MEIKMKIIHQGLILVCVPLAFELGIVFTLLDQTRQLETEVNKEKQAKLFLNTITEIVAQYFKVGHAISDNLYDASKENFEAYSEDLKSLPKYRKTAQDLLPSIPMFRASAEKLLLPLEKVETKHLQFAGELMLNRLLLKEAGLSPQFVSSMDARLYEDLDTELVTSSKFAAKYNSHVQKLIKTLEGAQAESPRIQEKIREQQKIVLFVAMGLSVVLALLLTFFFVTGIVRRLLTITDNTSRLKEEKELNPRIGGSDEIALLDGFFHEMSTALRQSREKERQMLEKIMIAEARVRSIIENMPVGVFILDFFGKIESVNPRVTEFFACSAEDIVNDRFEPLFEPGQSGSIIENLHKNQGIGIEHLAIRKNGEKFHAELILNEINTSEGPRRLISIQDVTAKHELERLKQEFYAMIAHDLRTPLTSTQLSLGVVIDGMLGELSPKVKETLQRAEAGISRLTSLINDFLDFEKLQSGKFDLNSKPMFLSSLIERSVSEVQGLADKHGLKIETPDLDLMTYADEERLIQVLINFLSNAIKFSPENSSIIIDAQKIEKDLLITVTDQGPGIPAELQERLFKSFSMLKNQSNKVKIKGTGLGLAICKMIVEQHGGSIGVKSSEGKGSSFWFQIPIKTS
ncbi:MAG: PAS domain-containing sensor histidine kinase [Candidatus Obscuribacterales bacterium]|nr:PAS domain-containing sensor histidine kinase [Candidatus Obscuribacterales bacterium]